MSEPQVRQAKIDSLEFDDRNANKGTERGLRALDHSLRQYGAGRSILLDKAGRIIAGNKTTQGAADIGLEDVIIVQTDGTKLVAVQRTDLDLNDKKARELALWDNRVGELDLSWDIDELLASVADGVDLSAMFRQDELDALLQAAHGQDEKATGEDVGAKVDKAAELKEQWGTRVGQVWQLGEHRIAVGDCTDKATVEAVMRGEKADMVFTDPPYNTGKQQGRTASEWGIIENDKLDDGHYLALLQGVEQITKAHNRGDLYVCCDYRCYPVVVDVWGVPRSCIVWAKDNFGLGVGYRRQHEFIAYWGGFKGNTEADLWEHAKVRAASYQHPTQKPVELIERAINNSGIVNAIVADWFLGSGTTLIACEKLNRKARCVELDEGYAAVSIQRWFDMTGKEPRLIT